MDKAPTSKAVPRTEERELQTSTIFPGHSAAPESSRGDAYLVVAPAAPGSAAGVVHQLPPGETVLGRGPGVDLVVQDEGISRKHAQISFQPDGACVLVDLGSRNGTQVNGAPVTTAVLLEHGDQIHIGRGTAIRFVRARGDAATQLAVLNDQVGTWEWDATTGELRWSRYVERRFGLPAGMLLHPRERSLERVHPGDRERVLGALRASLQSGQRCELELRLCSTPEHVRWFAVQGTPVQGNSPRVVCGTLSDITERKLREEELRRQAALLESLCGAVVSLDAETRVVEWSASCWPIISAAA
jgi:PAS domain S-box-containing protein